MQVETIRRLARQTLPAVLGFALSLPALAQVVTYKGIAYDTEDADEVLYLESHYLLLDEAGREQERLVLYRCPEGPAFARKTIDHSVDALRPSFELYDARLDYTEGLQTGPGDDLVYVKARDDSDRRSESLSLTEQAVADAGFDQFVRQNWDALQGGDKLRFDFLVPSRLSVLSFRVQKTHEHQVEGQTASVFRLGLSGVLGWFVSGIDVTYRDSDRQLLQFEGLSNVRDPAGDNYVARIVFPDSERRNGDEQDLSRARSEPLVSSCAPQ